MARPALLLALAGLLAACDTLGPAPTAADVPPPAAAVTPDCGTTAEGVFADVGAVLRERRVAGRSVFVAELDCPGALVFAVTGPFLGADNLPGPFRVDGLRVVLSGALAEVPGGVRLVAHPLRLTAIRAA